MVGLAIEAMGRKEPPLGTLSLQCRWGWRASASVPGPEICHDVQLAG